MPEKGGILFRSYPVRPVSGNDWFFGGFRCRNFSTCRVMIYDDLITTISMIFYPVFDAGFDTDQDSSRFLHVPAWMLPSREGRRRYPDYPGASCRNFSSLEIDKKHHLRMEFFFRIKHHIHKQMKETRGFS